MRNVLAVTAVVALSAGSAMAWDYNPPDWRGEPLSVMVEWNFDDSATAPNQFASVGGSAGETLYQPAPPAQWPLLTEIHLTTGDGRWENGAWTIIEKAQFRLEIPNWIDIQPEKWVHIQWHFTGGTMPVINSIAAYEGVDHWNVPVGEITRTVVAVDQYVDDFKILPNPDYEVITFTMQGSGVLEQIVVDTISLPEPASLTLLGLGALVTLCRKH